MLLLFLFNWLLLFGSGIRPECVDEDKLLTPSIATFLQGNVVGDYGDCADFCGATGVLELTATCLPMMLS